MRLSHGTILLLALFVVGCESTGGWQSPGRLAGAEPTITELGPSIPDSMLFSKVDKSSRPEEVREVRISTPEIRESSLNRASRQVNPFPTVFFPLDSYEIKAEVRERLNATAQWMNQYPTYGLRIEGHTDVRGTESYNMILSAKRAHAVKEYLSLLGIRSQRMETVSYGELLLVCDTHNEEGCHRYNRRAEMMIQ